MRINRKGQQIDEIFTQSLGWNEELLKRTFLMSFQNIQTNVRQRWVIDITKYQGACHSNSEQLFW